jgi:hypothetical protein
MEPQRLRSIAITSLYHLVLGRALAQVSLVQGSRDETTRTSSIEERLVTCPESWSGLITILFYSSVEELGIASIFGDKKVVPCPLKTNFAAASPNTANLGYERF